MADRRPDVVILMTDEERAVPPYESADVLAWRERTLTGRRWFDEHGVSFTRHYTGLAGLRAEPADDLHRPVSRSARRHPDRRHRQALRRFAAALAAHGRGADARQLVPRRGLRHPLRRQVAHLARRSRGPRHRRAAGHQRRRRRRRPGRGAGATSTPTRSDPYGFSGWVGPEPHGAAMSNSGFRRDPLFADRIVAWLEDRYARRRAGDEAALRPFLLVASFVNPHDIVLFPAWQRRSPLDAVATLDPPHVPAAPTADEDLRTKPAAQIAFREAYYSGYGPAPAIGRGYKRNAQQYRDLYYRLHAEVDGPLDRVRRAVTEGGSDERRAGAHVRSRRPARRARRPAPEVVQPLRRGHPGAVRHRPHRRRTRRRPRDRLGADVARRPGADAAGRGGHRRRRRRRRALPSRSPRCTRCRAAT